MMRRASGATPMCARIFRMSALKVMMRIWPPQWGPIRGNTWFEALRSGLLLKPDGVSWQREAVVSALGAAAPSAALQNPAR